MKKILFVLSLVIVVAGCTSVRISSPESMEGVRIKEGDNRQGRALVIANEGYYLFQTWVLVCGSLEWDPKLKEPAGGLEFFHHELDAQHFVDLMSKIAEREHCDIVDICIENKWTAPFGLFGLMDWFNTIVGYHRMNYSAVLVPREK